MPCFSKTETVLIELTVIQSVAKALGIEVIRRTANSYTLKRGTEQVGIERVREGEKFSTALYSGETSLLKELIPAYAKERVKQFAKSKGYTLSAGQKSGEYVLTKYS